MLEAESGTIINISSVAAIQPGPFSGVAYGAAKAAVNNFTQFLNADLLNTGVRASVIMPGEINTPILEMRPVPPSAEARATMADVEGHVGAHKPYREPTATSQHTGSDHQTDNAERRIRGDCQSVGAPPVGAISRSRPPATLTHYAL